MKALLYERFGGPIEVADVANPVAPLGGVVVRVTASGLCRSDWHAWAGHDPDVRLPQVPGHELAGVVDVVGAGVSRVRVGDRVTAPFVNGCGECDWCRSGQAQVCPGQTQPGFSHWGSHAERVVVRAGDLNLVPLPEDLSDDAAAALGCRFATSYRAVVGRARVEPGEWVVVYGAGGVGLSAVMIVAALGGRPLAVDRSSAALQLARRFGAEHTLLAGDDTPAAVVELTGGGAHVSIDAVGSVQTSTAAVRSLRRRGRHCRWACSPTVCHCCRWTGSSRGSWTSSARTGWPPRTPPCSTSWHAGPCDRRTSSRARSGSWRRPTCFAGRHGVTERHHGPAPDGLSPDCHPQVAYL